MKTLKNNTLIYDQECPLCKAYTSYFISTGLLDNNGRTPYNELSLDKYEHIDKRKARNEIALVDTNTGKVTYGVESLVVILGNQWPMISKLFRFSFIRSFVEKMYFFISYNRKVITPSKNPKDLCKPDVNLTYRWAYVILAWLLISVILFQFSQTISSIVPESNYLREFTIAGGQLLFQTVVLFLLRSKNKMGYLGNMMTISLFGSFLLIPILITNIFINLPYIFLIYFVGVVLWMVAEHYRRVKILSLPSVLTLTWILYRIIVLLIIVS